MDSPELSIVVASYKHPEMLRLCLRSLHDTVRDIPYEIVVADSATEADTGDMMAREFPDIPFFPFRENVGFQRLVRAGLEHVRGRYVLIMNHDIVATDGAVGKLLSFLRTHSDIGMVGPRLLNFNGAPQASCFRFYRPSTILYRRTALGKLPWAKRHLDWFLMNDYDHRRPKDVDWLMGSVLMIRREAYEKVGPMDSRFFMYMEDVDWCRRFWENGYRVVYYPDASFYHYHGKGSARGGFWFSVFFNRLTWNHIASGYKYFRKYAGKPVPRHDEDSPTLPVPGPHFRS